MSFADATPLINTSRNLLLRGEKGGAVRPSAPFCVRWRVNLSRSQKHGSAFYLPGLRPDDLAEKGEGESSHERTMNALRDEVARLESKHRPDESS